MASAAGAGALAIGASAGWDDAADAAGNRYFKHGVASGDPHPHSVILWTRVSPTAAATPGSGKGPRVSVTWQVAKDPAFKNVVRRGTFETGAGRDHTVKLEVGRLSPRTLYFYRFRYDGVFSRVGRTQTAPAVTATPENLRFGVASCANYQAGYFSAYRGLADRDDLDAIIHMGDYVYEYGSGEYGLGMGQVDVRPHDPTHEMVSLEDYRRRYAQYRQDADLQRLHAKYAFISTIDDHEVADNSWDGGAVNHDPATEGDYVERRKRAYRALDEWMPIRLGATVALGDGMRVYRRLQFGTLAELSMLELRQYRDEMVAVVPTPGPNPDAGVDDPDRTITGPNQMVFLKDALASDRAQWKIIGNPLMITPVSYSDLPSDVVGPITDMIGNVVPTDGATYNTDQWDGYTDDRREVFEFLRDQGIHDTVFITGDIHSGWACDLPVEAATYPVTGETVGVEFVGTSVTSNNLKDYTDSPARTTSLAVEAALTTANSHVKYLNFDDHGFSVLDVTSERTQMDWYVISARDDKDATITWTTSWATDANTQKVRAADGPVA
jgi:alkaline phosphatase D